MEEQVRLLKHKRFAASSEKPDCQTELFNEAEAAEPVPEEDLNENTDDAETESIQYKRRKSRGRKALPATYLASVSNMSCLMPTKSVIAAAR
ncbi:MAG: transposase [Zhongshania sp.]